MSKSRKSGCLGDCAKRLIKVKNSELCDWYEAKNKDRRYKSRCRNCSNFIKIQLNVTDN